jgi:hypothetical protein
LPSGAFSDSDFFTKFYTKMCFLRSQINDINPIPIMQVRKLRHKGNVNSSFTATQDPDLSNAAPEGTPSATLLCLRMRKIDGIRLFFGFSLRPCPLPSVSAPMTFLQSFLLVTNEQILGVQAVGLGY